MRRRLLAPASFRYLCACLMLGLLLAGCGALPTNMPEMEEEDTQTLSPVATAAALYQSPILPTATAAAAEPAFTATAAAPTATSTAIAATATSAPRREAVRLVVLHTNDNWGETEPCG